MLLNTTRCGHFNGFCLLDFLQRPDLQLCVLIDYILFTFFLEHLIRVILKETHPYILRLHTKYRASINLENPPFLIKFVIWHGTVKLGSAWRLTIGSTGSP